MTFENYSFVSWSDGTPITSARLQQMSTNIDQVKSALTTTFSGYRNLFINGGMSIDQRNNGASQTFTAGAALAYSIDRWYGYCTGANLTGQRVSGSAPDQFYYRFTGAASVTGVGFGQRIEQLNSFHLAGQQAILSVSLASSSLTTVTWTAYYANTANTFGTLASPTRTQIATGVFNINSTLSRYEAAFPVSSLATTGIEIVFTAGALLATHTLTISNAQLESGVTSTDFERKPYTLEESLCQRYYYRITSPNAGITRFGMGQCTSTTVATILTPFPVTMRSSPSAIEQSGTASHYAVTSATNATTACSAVPAFGTANQYMATTTFTVASGLTAGHATSGMANNTASAYLGWSVEL